MLGVSVRISKWEADLWSYVSSGDGMLCPLYDRCQTRRRGGWYLSDNRQQLRPLRNGSQFNPSDYGFFERVTPCRMLKLVALLAQNLVKKGRVDYPPVLTSLAYLADDQHPIEVRSVPLKTNHAGIWHLQDGWVIQLNQNDPPVERRFSLFHEVFHILAHCRATPVFKKRGRAAGSFNETLAEFFASCVLMPPEWVEEKWAEVNNIHQMAEIFDVTERAMWVRLKFLHLV